MTANAIAYASAVDAAGNVFVTGGFTGTLTFGTISLTSRGTNDVFVAKWDATAQTYTWATSGGGTGEDYGYGIAVSGTGVFVTGTFQSASNANLAGQALPGAGDRDVFVVKYLDTSTGHTPATSSVATGWVVSSGGPGHDYGNSIAVSGTGVFVTGSFTSGTGARLAGQVLSGAGGLDMFVAKYLDTSTGNTPATSSVANGWATSGGGTGRDEGYGIAVQGTGVFVTGKFTSASTASFAGQTLIGAGGYDVFVAKYIDLSSVSVANGWATSDGGTADDAGLALAVSGQGVFITGYFTSATTPISLAGQALSGAGSSDMFVAKYLDTSTGNTPATSSFANGWATSGGGSLNDQGLSVALSSKQVYVVGLIQPFVYFGSLFLANAPTGTIDFLARLTDATLTPLPVRVASAASTNFALYPNPTRTTNPATLTGATPATTGQVLDALGRHIATFPTNASGAATLPAGLVPGLYVVRVGAAVGRWVVE